MPKCVCVFLSVYYDCLVLADGSSHISCAEARIKYTEPAFLFKVLIMWNCRPTSEVVAGFVNYATVSTLSTCQVAQGRDWQRRFYPSDASTNARVLGPSCPPHGMNWRIAVPSCYLAFWFLHVMWRCSPSARRRSMIDHCSNLEGW